MKRFVLGLVAVLALGFGGCCAVDKAAVDNVEKTHSIVLPKYIKYVEADTTLTEEQKDDQRKLVESLKRLVVALRESAK